MMTDDDQDLENELRHAAQVMDPVSPQLRQSALDAFTLRTLDAELAELVFDSLVASDAGPVRGGDQPRLLTFRATGVRIEVEVVAAGRGWRLVGQLIPPTPAEVEIRGPGGATTAVADDLGRFAADVPGTGPVSLRLARAGAATVVTEWMSL